MMLDEWPEEEEEDFTYTELGRVRDMFLELRDCLLSADEKLEALGEGLAELQGQIRELVNATR